MKRREILAKLTGMMLAAAMVMTMAPLTAFADEAGEWREEDGNFYWYENGVKQGTEGRGKEIYDPASDAWYWLDSIDGGRKATGKDVYQESLAGEWGDATNDAGERIGKWVRYDADGHMVKGWQTNDAGTYYFDLTYGTMAKGNTTIDGVPCSFDQATGIGADCQWVEIDGVKYWYEGGKRQGLEGRGKEIYDPASDAWYWLDSIDNGKMATSKDVYQESSGGKWVRYDENGHMVKGWNEQNGNRYYFDPVTGAMAKGTVEIDGVVYAFDETTGVLCGYGVKSYGLGVAYHSQGEIEQYMASSGITDALISGTTTMVSDPVLSAPYAAGKVSDESLGQALAMLNQIRYIAGLDSGVTLNDTYTQMAQTGVMLNAVNNQLSHYPSRPSGMSDELYELGYSGTSSSNLAMTSWRSSLLKSLMMWMDDSDSSNIDRLGHRRWILNPTMQQTGFGYAVSNSGAAYSSVYVFDYDHHNMDVTGVAWPATVMPKRYFESSSAWSYSYGSSLNGNVSVKLQCLTTGRERTWNFSSAASDGYFNVNNGGYGQKGCVIFKPDSISIQAGEDYEVTITQDATVIADYTVHFF
ncbi:CAP domain-containing protein [Roseburia hominis]|uniref:CAP domain-containing protein n=1 Tax=Roseburia hominis TaxID=301301 RepID=UPI0026EF55DC|nr:CAP domain-containing protein [Roseburia hominis]MCI7523130.1 CAP domain-containing protein [Roseburia hominis]